MPARMVLAALVAGLLLFAGGTHAFRACTPSAHAAEDHSGHGGTSGDDSPPCCDEPASIAAVQNGHRMHDDLRVTLMAALAVGTAASISIASIAPCRRLPVTHDPPGPRRRHLFLEALLL